MRLKLPDPNGPRACTQLCKVYMHNACSLSNIFPMPTEGFLRWHGEKEGGANRIVRHKFWHQHHCPLFTEVRLCLLSYLYIFIGVSAKFTHDHFCAANQFTHGEFSL